MNTYGAWGQTGGRKEVIERASHGLRSIEGQVLFILL
jgi:hypothetical protein